MNRYDFELIASWIPERARVLDLGCGDGVLLAGLSATHSVNGYGVEIDAAGVAASVRNGVKVIPKDIETGPSDFREQPLRLLDPLPHPPAMPQREATLPRDAS